jgi:hypothetical protein
MTECPVYLRIPAAASFVGKFPRVTHSGHNEAMLDVGNLGFVKAEPGD